MNGKPPKFCTECGSPVRAGARFCKKCGAELEAIQKAAKPPPLPDTSHPTEMQAEEAPGIKQASKGKKSRAFLIAAIVVVFIVLVGGGTIATILILKSESSTIPDVEGLEVNEAIKIIQAEGLVIQEVYRESDEFEKDIVISQNPLPGGEAEKGSEVIITVSKGADQEEVGETDGDKESTEEDVLSTEAGRNTPFWTVILASLDPRSGHTQAEAEDFADAAARSGLDAGVLDSTKFKSLRQPYWVVYSGIFKDPGGQSQAEAHMEEAKAAGYPNAYVRFVDFEGPGEIGPVIP